MYSFIIYLFIYYLFSSIINIFYEVHIGNKCTFVCCNVFILGKITYMFSLVFVFASKLF